MNWNTFIDPSFWDIIARMCMNAAKVVGSLCWMYVMLMCLWHGVQIGTPDSGFYVRIPPLKRFFTT